MTAIRDEKLTTKVLPSWPVVVGLGMVTLLIAGMIGLDLYFAEEEASRTIEVIEHAQDSVLLLNDIRFDANRLLLAKADDDIEHLRRNLASHGRRYDRTVTAQGEREKWNHLQALLRQLPGGGANRNPAAPGLGEAIDQSIDALIAINTGAGHGNLATIRAAHRRAIWGDTVAGTIVLAVVTLISAWLLRVLSRQRQLVLRQVQFLDEKNAELEAFAGRAAHDLRSPMNPIRGYAELILETPSLPENVASMAQRIRRSVDRMTRVVDDMLALAVSGRPPAGQSPSSVVVERVLEEMGADLQGAEVVTKLAGGHVRCAEGTLSQILRNLLGNAIKFRSRSRPLRIVIETRDVDSMVELVVEDNGIGMDSESAKRVFEPFYRGPTDREVPGHGLGLAIVERVTHALGGTCELTSVLDQSTRIVLRLPRS
jgi:signal transduction histidine kinase